MNFTFIRDGRPTEQRVIFCRKQSARDLRPASCYGPYKSLAIRRHTTPTTMMTFFPPASGDCDCNGALSSPTRSRPRAPAINPRRLPNSSVAQPVAITKASYMRRGGQHFAPTSARRIDLSEGRLVRGRSKADARMMLGVIAQSRPPVCATVSLSQADTPRSRLVSFCSRWA